MIIARFASLPWQSVETLFAEDIKDTSRRSLTEIKVIETTHKQMERRREGTRGRRRDWRNWRWHVINRWSDKFKCFSPWQKIERLRVWWVSSMKKTPWMAKKKIRRVLENADKRKKTWMRRLFLGSDRNIQGSRQTACSLRGASVVMMCRSD